VLRQHKPLVIVINEDLMSNHQKELAQQLENDNYLFYCYSNTLRDKLNEIDLTQLRPFPEPNPSLFANFIDNILLSRNSDNIHVD
jgi:beta-1,4-N-acetylglucosaminyltransferase